MVQAADLRSVLARPTAHPLQAGNIELITLGTTIGMMLANVPAVLLEDVLTKVVPLQHVRRAAALLFAAIGTWVVFSAFNAM
jgi:putative Ca2+/H+ antiporter (TMEM165/GDT1 family)